MAMKITDEQGNIIQYKGLSTRQYQELSTLINRFLEIKPYVVLCIKGNKGVGKTTLAKYMRKYGFGPFRAKDVAVIDDDCMSVDVLGIFRRKYYNPCKGVDELEPFFKYCKNKRIRCYVKANPETRITYADILIEVEADEHKRQLRLYKRYDRKRAEQVIAQSNHYTHQPKIAFQYEMIADIE
jgi:energy-coupling factor transporter ATP-binding protein EcfA2